MPVTNNGRDHIAGAVIGTGTAYTSANAYIGVGSGTVAFSATQSVLGTELGRKAMDGGYPTVTSGNVLNFRSTFSTSDANGAWQEWGVFNASANGTMFNRKVESNGTKPGTQTWQFTVSITLTVPAT